MALPVTDLSFITERTGMQWTPNATGIAAVDESGRIHGMAAYDEWKRSTVQMHVRLDDWGAARCLLGWAFWFPFVQRHMAWVRAEVTSKNTRSLRLVQHLGFREIARIPGGWEPGDDLVLFAMHRDECRFLRQKAVA